MSDDKVVLSITKSPGKLRDLKLYRGAINLLQSLLVQAGWTKKMTVFNRGCRLGTAFEDLLESSDRPEEAVEGKRLDDPAVKAYIAKVKEWSNVEVEVKVTEKEADALKECFKHFLSEGRIPGTKYASQVIDELGLADADTE